MSEEEVWLSTIGTEVPINLLPENVSAGIQSVTNYGLTAFTRR